MAGSSSKSLRSYHAKTLKIVVKPLSSLKSGNPQRKFLKILKTKLKLLKIPTKGRKKQKGSHNAKYFWARRVPSPSKPTRRRPSRSFSLILPTLVKFHRPSKKSSFPSRAFKSCQFSDIFIYYVSLYQSYLHLFLILIHYLITTQYSSSTPNHINSSPKVFKSQRTKKLIKWFNK